MFGYKQRAVNQKGSSYRSHFYVFVILFRFNIAFTLHSISDCMFFTDLLKSTWTDKDIAMHGIVILILDLSHEWIFSMNLISSLRSETINLPFVVNCNNRHREKRMRNDSEHFAPNTVNAMWMIKLNHSPHWKYIRMLSTLALQSLNLK